MLNATLISKSLAIGFAGAVSLGLLGGGVVRHLLNHEGSLAQSANSHLVHTVSEHTHAPHGKPGADVVNQNTTGYFLDVFEERDLTLTLSTEHANGALTIDLETDEGLMLISEKSHWKINIDQPQAINLPIRLYGAAEGRHHVHIFITHTDIEGKVTARALAQQVDVGTGSLETQRYKSAKVQHASEVVLPAAEEIY